MMEIRIQGLTKKFGETYAINNLTVTFASGQLTSLLGPSGSGKSTLLNVLSGIIPATTGTIHFGDRNVTDLLPEKRDIGLVFQNYALYPHMSVYQNIEFPLINKKMPKKERHERIHEMAELVQLGHLLNRKPAQLSGGQQQRVAIARAIAKAPQILLLDEPLSNLDARLRLEMREEIRRIQQATGITTILVTHDQEDALSIADRILLLNNGVVQQVADPLSLYNDPENIFTAQFIGTPPINLLQGEIRGGRFVLADQSAECAIPGDKRFADQSDVVLGIRAESIVRDFGSQQQLNCEVLRSFPKGKDELAYLAFGSKEITAYIDSELGLRPGDRAGFKLKEKGVFLFDAKTGARLR